MTRDLLSNSTIRSLIPAVRSLAATLTGSAVDLRGMGRKVLVILDVGGVEGTTPSVDVRIQESDDGTTWVDLHIFALRTTAGTLIVDLRPTRRQIRARAVIAGGAAAGTTLAIEGIVYLERQRPSGI